MNTRMRASAGWRRMLPASFAEATAVKMWKCCQVQIQFPMKGAGVDREARNNLGYCCDRRPGNLGVCPKTYANTLSFVTKYDIIYADETS